MCHKQNRLKILSLSLFDDESVIAIYNGANSVCAVVETLHTGGRKSQKLRCWGRMGWNSSDEFLGFAQNQSFMSGRGFGDQQAEIDKLKDMYHIKFFNSFRNYDDVDSNLCDNDACGYIDTYEAAYSTAELAAKGTCTNFTLGTNTDNGDFAGLNAAGPQDRNGDLGLSYAFFEAGFENFSTHDHAQGRIKIELASKDLYIEGMHFPLHSYGCFNQTYCFFQKTSEIEQYLQDNGYTNSAGTSDITKFLNGERKVEICLKDKP